jgi:acyl-CoA-binding protein
MPTICSVRVKRKKTYTPICNSLSRHPNLSYESRGVAGYMLTFPEDWKFNKKSLEQQGCGRDKLTRIFKELQKYGFLYEELKRDKKGKIIDHEWIITDCPILGDLIQTTENPSSGDSSRQLKTRSLDSLYKLNNNIYNIYNNNTSRSITNAKKENKPTDYESISEEILKNYPKRDGALNKKAARKKISGFLKTKKYTEEFLTNQVSHYAAYCQSANYVNTMYVMMASTFFGKDDLFLEDWANMKGKTQQGNDKNDVISLIDSLLEKKERS